MKNCEFALSGAPLRAMQGYSELLAQLNPPLEGEALTFLQHIRQSARRMNTLIDDMLSLSKLTRAEVRKRPVSIGVMARDILAGLRDTAPTRQVRTVVDESLMAEADAGLLRLILDNLLSNAWKYTGKRGDALIEFFAEAQADGELWAEAAKNCGATFRFTLPPTA